MATLTVRNIPDDAKYRFRQVAAARGRSMEEHLRRLVIEADFEGPKSLSEDTAAEPDSLHPTESREDWVRELIRIADGAGKDVFDAGRYAEIRFMTAKDAMAELRRLANGLGLDLPPAMNTEMEAPLF